MYLLMMVVLLFCLRALYKCLLLVLYKYQLFFSLNLIQITSVVLSSNLEHEVLIFFNHFAGTAFFKI